ncbi:MAG: glycosyltransferase [Cellvibrionaceae bacterium]
MNLLFVIPYYACDDKTGGGQRTRLLLKSVCSLKDVSIDLIILGEQGKQYPQDIVSEDINKATYLDLLPRAKIGFWKFLRPLNPSKFDSLATALGRRAVLYSSDMLARKNVIDFSQYDVVVSRYLRPLSQTGVFDSSVSAKIYLDIDDRDDVLYSSRMNMPTVSLWVRLFFSWHLKQIQSIQKKILPLCDHVWLASDKDLQQLPTRKESVLNNIPYSLPEKLTSSAAVSQNNKTLLFVGSYGHRINKEGVKHFLNVCWPKIIKASPEISLRIVGSGGWQNIKSEVSSVENVEIVGFCDDLNEEYKKALFTIVPLYEGGGTKIKVLESYLFGRLAVGTQHAYFGYDKLSELSAKAISDNDEALINNVLYFLENPKICHDMAVKGSDFVSDNYTFESFKKSVLSVFE